MHENVSYFPTLTSTEPEEISWETVTTTIRGEFLREKTEFNERNKAFLTPDPAKEMIVTFFTKPIGESETKYMTATKIAGKFAPYLKISPTKVGIAMAEMGFEQVRTKHGRFWKVADRPGNEIYSRMPGEKPEPIPF